MFDIFLCEIDEPLADKCGRTAVLSDKFLDTLQVLCPTVIVFESALAQKAVCLHVDVHSDMRQRL